MKKKLLITIATAIILALCLFAFAACDGDGDNGEAAESTATKTEETDTEADTSDITDGTDTSDTTDTLDTTDTTEEDIEIPTEPTEGLQYELSEDKKSYTVKGIGSAKDEIHIVIPSTYEGLPVTVVGYGAFRNCTDIKSLTIPDSVTSIGDYAFTYCTGLKKINLGNGVTSIGSYAFRNCTGIKSLTIPDSVTSIGDYAFRNCAGLTSITLPFVGATKDGTSYTHFGYIFGASSYSENSYYVPTSLKTVVITGVTSIGNGAFSYCEGLTSITIPDSVTSIGNGAFFCCTGLISVTIPDSVTSIGEYAFEGCNKLIEVYDLSSSLTITVGSSSNGYVGYYAKYVYTSSSEESKLHTTSDGYIFYEDGTEVYLMGYVGEQTALTLPNNYNGDTYEIYSYAFYNCTGLTSITIPDSVTSIGDYAFLACTGLTSITFTGTVDDWNAISKGSWWNYRTGTYVIYCTDGEITKSGTVTMY